MRRTRSGIEDRWTKTVRVDGKMVKVPSANAGKGSRYRARYVDDQGHEHAKGFSLKREAQVWLDGQVSTVVQGTHVAPRDAMVTVEQWCETWMQGYASKRPNTVRSAKVHIRQINAEFGNKTLSEVRPSQVKAWIARLKADGLADSYIFAIHRRLSQIMSDAVHDGVLGRSPCSRRTSPPRGKQKPYCATEEQVWALHDVMPDHLRVAILLGAFVGLRVGEASGLRVSDVDFIRGVVHPKQQWAGEPLKTPASDAPIPIPQDLALWLSASVKKYGTTMMVTNSKGKGYPPDSIERVFRNVREKVEGLPEGFTFQDLRHYFASMLIADGADIKEVQARLRHEDATTTLNTYGHLWPDADESTRHRVAKALKRRMKTADALRTKGLL
jgi:integrase